MNILKKYKFAAVLAVVAGFGMTLSGSQVAPRQSIQMIDTVVALLIAFIIILGSVTVLGST